MKIAFIGTQCNGKSTLINEFLKQWPMYTTPKKTYRDILKEKNVSLNREGNEESQRIILDALIDEAQLAVGTGEKHIVFDRCVVDNIVYTLWLNAKGKVKDSFVVDTKFLALQTLKLFDIIFYLPLRDEIKVEEKENRDIDIEYRKEIDHIFRALVLSYERGTGAFFPKEDCPAVITLEGPPDLRCEQIKLYIKDSGSFYGEEDGSLIST